MQHAAQLTRPAPARGAGARLRRPWTHRADEHKPVGTQRCPVEDYIDARYLDEKEDVEDYTALWHRLQAAALGPVESRTFVLEVAGSVT